MGETLFDVGSGLTEEDSLLIAVYQRAGRTLDDLPYTPQLDEIAGGVGRPDDPRAVFHRLHTLRKAGKLPRLGRAETSGVRLEPEEEALVVSLVEGAVGSLGQRDQLPYTLGFDEVLERFNAQTGRSLDRHALWRLIAKLAK